MKKELLEVIEKKLNEYINNEINFLEVEELMIEIEKNTLNTPISDALFHALIHYEGDKDIHAKDINYEIQQKKEITTLFKCLKSNDLSPCKEILLFMSPKEFNNRSIKNFFIYLKNKLLS